jgi:hypothetical protein
VVRERSARDTQATRESRDQRGPESESVNPGGATDARARSTVAPPPKVTLWRHTLASSRMASAAFVDAQGWLNQHVAHAAQRVVRIHRGMAQP